MAKKKKEVCPFCGKSFTYLSRHKCKVQKDIEGEPDDKSDSERRQERIEETRIAFTRDLKKEEQKVLKIINEKKDIYFDELIKITGKQRSDLEEIVEILALQSKIKLNRELVSAAWTKHIFSIEDYENEIQIDAPKINKKRPDFLWNQFSRQPCFICPFVDKCNETNLDQFNPHHCPWLTEWIEISLEGKEYNINFDEIQERLIEE